MTSKFLQQATSPTSNERILQRVTSDLLQQATSATSNEQYLQRATSARSNERILQWVASIFFATRNFYNE